MWKRHGLNTRRFPILILERGFVNWRQSYGSRKRLRIRTRKGYRTWRVLSSVVPPPPEPWQLEFTLRGETRALQDRKGSIIAGGNKCMHLKTKLHRASVHGNLWGETSAIKISTLEHVWDNMFGITCSSQHAYKNPMDSRLDEFDLMEGQQRGQSWL